MTKYILITLCCFIAALSAEAKHKITGRVSNENGRPLAGVQITKNNEKESREIVAVTDADGTFFVETEKYPVELEFTHPGYEANQMVYQDEAEEKTVMLEKRETGKVNIAYGEKTPEQITSSVFTISGEELLSSRSANLMTALQGKVPGLQILQNSGEPGMETHTALIRGQDSPNRNTIMFIVDGVERDPSTVSLYDIESVTVLRDAAATAMYGLRSAGGVLLITTKEGYAGKPEINVHVDHSIQAPTRRPDIVSAYDYAKMYNQRRANDTLYADAQDIASGGMGLDHSGTDFYSPYAIDRYQKADFTEFFPVRDMVDDFMKDFSQLTRVNVNFRGGTEMMRYFTSVGYQHQGSLFENEPFDVYSYDAEQKNNRFNFRTNMDVSLNETLDFWAYIGGSLEKNNGPRIDVTDVLAKLYETPNNAHNDLTPEGEVLVKRNKLSFATNRSVYGDLNRRGSRLETVTRLGNTFGARQELNRITEGLSATAQLTFDIFSQNIQNRTRSYEAWEVATLTDVNGADSLGYVKVPGTSNSTLSDGQGKFFRYMYNFRASVDYDHTFKEKHDLTAKLLAERYMQQRQDLPNSNYMGLAGRVSYAYANRYFGEVSFAYQGSEQFAEGNRFGLFPAVSAGWLVSNEAFLEDVEAINYLKVRASAGQTGNNVYDYGASNQYLYLTTWNTNATEDQLGNPSIQWETSTKYNAGLEAQILDALFLSADYFYNTNNDIIVRDVDIIPNGMMGISASKLPPLNIGETVNKGFEFVAAYTKQFSNDLVVDIQGNISFTENEYIDMAELPYDETYAYPYRNRGYPLNYYWGYKTDGLFNNQSEIDNWADQSELGGVPIPGDIKYVDLNGDEVINQKDRAPLGTGPLPESVYGLQAQVAYKGVDLKVFFNGTGGRNVFLNSFGRWSNRDNFTEYMKNAWTPEKAASGQEILYPRLAENSTNYILSDYWIEDGSYIRLRNVELGYTLPGTVTRTIGSKSIRIYVNGLNLLVWDNLPNDDFDPETAASNNLGYPVMKAWNVGVNVKF